jgi:hypothetical protein
MGGLASAGPPIDFMAGVERAVSARLPPTLREPPRGEAHHHHFRSRGMPPTLGLGVPTSSGGMLTPSLTGWCPGLQMA